MTGAIKVDHEVDIRRELDDVFAFVSDGERLPAWMAGVKRARRTSPPGPIGVGTTYVVVGKLLGRGVESTYELTAYEPGRSFSATLRSPAFTVDDTYTFEASEDATTVRRSASAVPLGRLKLLGPVLTMAMQRQVKNDNRRLARVLERSPRSARVTAPAEPAELVEPVEPAEPVAPPPATATDERAAEG